MRQKVTRGVELDFSVVNDVLRFKSRVCVLNMAELKNKILMEAYNLYYIAYLGSVNMNQELRKSF